MLFIDAIHVKIRDGKVANRPIYTAVAVSTDGERDTLRPSGRCPTLLCMHTGGAPAFVVCAQPSFWRKGSENPRPVSACCRVASIITAIGCARERARRHDEHCGRRRRRRVSEGSEQVDLDAVNNWVRAVPGAVR